jgi:hypothetical protein
MLFDVGHVAKLHEIQKARLRAGQPGIGAEVEELIRRLESGGVAGKSDDPRTVQAKKWWDAGVGRELGIRSFKEYLATIPEIPASLAEQRYDFPLLVLVERRLCTIVAARFAGLKYGELGYTDGTLVPVDGRHMLPEEPFWIRAHDGGPNLDRKPSVCLAECIGDRFAGTDSVGIAIHLVHGKRGHVMDLPGSVRAVHREYCACVDPFGDPELRAGRHDGAIRQYGTVVFVRK